MVEHYGENTLWLYWEGPKPEWIRICEDLLHLHNPTAVTLSPEGLLELGFPANVWQAIQHWHVAQRSDAIRFWLLHRFGGMWCDIDCIPMRSFANFITLAKHALAGVSAYDSTDKTVGCGFIAARPNAPPIKEMWHIIETTALSGKVPQWLEVSTRPLTEIVKRHGRENFLLWPLNHISPISWRDSARFLERGTEEEHDRLFRGFPAAWCWMLCHHKLKDLELDGWSRYELLHGTSLLSYLIRRSYDAARPQRIIPKGRAVATLNVHNDWLPHNFRESMRHAAQRWGAEFVEIRTPIVPWPDPYWEKLNLDRHLTMYERVVYLDRDVVIRSDCPNLFELVPEEAFGYVPSEQPGHELVDIHIRPNMQELVDLLQLDFDYTRDYLNSGVMIFSPQRHKQVFSLARDLHPIPWKRNWVTVDQGLIALALKLAGVPVKVLPPEFNRCGDKVWNHWKPEIDDYVWHFCGRKTWEKMANTIWKVT